MAYFLLFGIAAYYLLFRKLSGAPPLCSLHKFNAGGTLGRAPDLRKNETMKATMENNIFNKGNWPYHKAILALIVLLTTMLFCCDRSTEPPNNNNDNPDDTPRLALWLAQKSELLANADAHYDLVMSGWFETAEADTITSRHSPVQLMAGLTHTWVLDDPVWREFLVTIANGGNSSGLHQITNDMYLMLDVNDDGTLDVPCTPPGWANIHAMDPRHPGWRTLICAFYETVAAQSRHDGIIIDMVDAYSFCEGGWSGGVTTPIDSVAWVSAQCELLDLINAEVPGGKLIIANAGHDFPEGSPFPQYVNGYLLENFLGSWGATLTEGLASAQRALTTTTAPHIVVFAVDTDDTGIIDWNRFRTGLVASLLLDNTYFAFDYGSRNHGGVSDYWFSDYYEISPGNPLGTFTLTEGIYRRDFTKATVILAAGGNAHVVFDTPHEDVATGVTGLQFDVSQGDARIFLRIE